VQWEATRQHHPRLPNPHLSQFCLRRIKRSSRRNHRQGRLVAQHPSCHPSWVRGPCPRPRPRGDSDSILTHQTLYPAASRNPPPVDDMLHLLDFPFQHHPLSLPLSLSLSLSFSLSLSHISTYIHTYIHIHTHSPILSLSPFAKSTPLILFSVYHPHSFPLPFLCGVIKRFIRMCLPPSPSIF